MNKTFKTLLPLTIIAFCLSFTISDGWIDFSTHGFAVSIPKKPDADSQVVNSPVGLLHIHNYMYDASVDSSDENLLYGVMKTVYNDSLAKELEKPSLVKGLLDGVTKGAVKTSLGKLLSQKDAEFNGYPGREVKISVEEGLAIIRMRTYLVHTHMYTLQVISYTEKDENKSIYRFINSFKLVNNKL